MPILPPSFEVQDKQNNESVTIHTVGEVNLLGMSGLREISISTLYPANDYEWQQTPTEMKPYDFVDELKKWKDTRTIIELTVTDTNINWDITIEQLTFSEDDVTGDLNYTLQLKEYRTLTRVDKVAKSTGSKSSNKSKKKKYKIKKGDTLKKIAKKKMGASKYSKTIYKKNKKVIEAALKKYVKKYNKAVKKYNKKHSKKKKYLKWKNSKKGKRLIPGTVIIIPPKPKPKTNKKK